MTETVTVYGAEITFYKKQVDLVEEDEGIYLENPREKEVLERLGLESVSYGQITGARCLDMILQSIRVMATERTGESFVK